MEESVQQLRLWLGILLGPIVTGFGFLFVYQQLTLSKESYVLAVKAAERSTDQAVAEQKWKKAEFLANQVKDFEADEIINRVTLIIDWSGREFPIPANTSNHILGGRDHVSKGLTARIAEYARNYAFEGVTTLIHS
jgi:hypothetical protein